MFGEVLIIGVVALVVVGVLWWQQQRQLKFLKEHYLESLVQQVFGATSQKIAEQSHAILAGERTTMQVDLANKQAAIEKLVARVEVELHQRQQELQQTEQQRQRQFGELSAALQQQRQVAEELRVSTQQLARVLSNNQARGEWGERILEDLLRANGLVEGVQYVKQQAQGNSARPDFMLLLPNERYVPIDVKFPYAEVQKMSEAETKAARAEHMRQFAQDLRTKVRKVAEYIKPEENSLDYAILFVPNEMVFSFINQHMPEVVDEAISARVLIVSPFTFLVVARTVLETYRNFMIEDRLKELLKYITEFVSEWGVFQEELTKFGRSVSSLHDGYEKLTTTRTTQLEKKMAKIDAAQRGTLTTKPVRKALKTAS